MEQSQGLKHALECLVYVLSMCIQTTLKQTGLHKIYKKYFKKSNL
jgi:hypothetical protein